MDLDKYFNSSNNYSLVTEHIRGDDENKGEFIKFIKYNETIYIIAIFTCSATVTSDMCSFLKDKKILPFIQKSFVLGENTIPKLRELPFDNVAYHYFYRNPKDNLYYFQNKYVLSTILNMKPITTMTNSVVNITDTVPRILNYSVQNKANRCAIESVLSLYHCYRPVMNSLIQSSYRQVMDEYASSLSVSTTSVERSPITDMFLQSLSVSTEQFEQQYIIVNGITYYKFNYDNYPVNASCVVSYNQNSLLAKLFYESSNTIKNPYDDNQYFRKITKGDGSIGYFKEYPYDKQYTEEEASTQTTMFDITSDGSIMLPTRPPEEEIEDILSKPFLKYNESYALVSFGDVRLAMNNLRDTIFNINTPKTTIKQTITTLLQGGDNKYGNQIRQCINIPNCLKNEKFEVLGGIGYSVDLSTLTEYSITELQSLNHYTTFICDAKADGMYMVDSITEGYNSEPDRAGILPMAYLIQFTGYSS